MAFQQAVRLNPDSAHAYFGLGNALGEKGFHREAIVAFEQALQWNPNFAEAHFNLGVELSKCDLLDRACAAYQQTLRLKPSHTLANVNLANVLISQGQIDEAIRQLKKARQSGYLFCMNYQANSDALVIREEHRLWEEEYALPLLPAKLKHGNDPDPDRRMRIGYVSPDFRKHVVGHYIRPILRHHNHTQFDITLYSNLKRGDELTEELRQHADKWCDIAGMTDDEVVAQIRCDGIDILVDLALHTDGNRLLVFARKPAPVQVTYAGYPGTTGLRAIDYRLTDPYLDPPGENDQWYAEKSYRLPHSFWCIDQVAEEPAVGQLPVLEKKYLTFGSLNNFCKVNDDGLKLWARVLCAKPESRLLLLSKEGSHRQKTLDSLAGYGIIASRIEFLPRLPRRDYLAYYNQIDIGLDTLPYNGHTTSLDAFWMGVPVVTLVGGTVVGRAGLSQLMNLGLPELTASTPDDFVRIAADLANDLPRLVSLRGGLRERMRRSPMMDCEGFTRDIETAYRDMWQTWCAQQQGR
jgi:predicted O-linked N-acetylglucosamine transferase (SPINDLY family)